jgi:hypothetical protein
MSKPTREELLKTLPVYETKEGEIIAKDKVADYEKTYNSSAYPVYDDEQVEQILNAETEAQQSCKMCHAPLSGRAYTIADYQHLIKNFISGLNSDAIKNIQYCQWCGRKLH